MGGFWGTSIKAFSIPPLEGASTIHETYSFLSLCELFPTPLCEVCVICEKSDFGLRESSLWSFEHLSFVKQSLWHLLLMEVKPPRRLGVALEFSRLWWAGGSLWRSTSPLQGKKQELSGVGKAVERDPAWSLLLVGNSRFLNGYIGIMSWWFQPLTNKSPCSSFGLSPCVLAYRFA
jgi:hypothetical protein